ncbi:glycoside hydrolase family 28 protein [Spirosoma soli]|uniref:Glycoside hydrolase family 28 protein n=1 Tax=Spirosoma soli TaxID=1770529 RepID=A0ABW5M6V0_9BACT
MNKLLFLFGLSLLSSSSFGQATPTSILSYGAKADGKTNNAAAIQRAIDDVSTKGGGRVSIPNGVFLTGQLVLKSGVDLHLADNAILLGSPNRLDYTNQVAMGFIVARNQQNVSITGRGVIDGQGRLVVQDLLRLLRAGKLQDNEYKQKRPTGENRPMLIELINCQNVRVTGITAKDAANWVTSYRKCTNLTIDSVRVESTAYWNNDGIDLVDCKDVTITNCIINATDDGICLKSEDPGSRCENISVAHCTIRSSASAFKLGTGSYGGFKHITVRDLTVYDTFRSAIALECVDGGLLEDIDIRNVKATNTGNAIFIRLGHRRPNGPVSQVRNIRIANVEVEVPQGKPDIGYPIEGPPIKEPHNLIPASITGLPDHPVQQVVLENISIVYGGGGQKKIAHVSIDSLATVPERPTGYPEFSMFGELPAWGFYVRHAEGVQFKNVQLRYESNDFRPACVFDDVKTLVLDNLQIPQATSLPSVVLHNVPAPSLKNVQLPAAQEQAVKILTN